MKNLTNMDRPKYLNLLRIRLPITGVVSIFHRITGVIMIFSIPFFIMLLSQSLYSAQGFANVQAMLQSGAGKLLMILALFAVSHHFFAGIRYLLFDLDVGVNRKHMKPAAWFVVIADVLAFGMLAGWLL